MTNSANGPIICTYYAQSELSRSTIQYYYSQPNHSYIGIINHGRNLIWLHGRADRRPTLRSDQESQHSLKKGFARDGTLYNYVDDVQRHNTPHDLVVVACVGIYRQFIFQIENKNDNPSTNIISRPNAEPGNTEPKLKCTTFGEVFQYSVE